MKHLNYLLLLLLPLAYSCDPSNAKEEEEENLCAAGDALDQLNCKVGFANWRLKSVTSDVPRTDSIQSSTDWMVFRPECYRDGILDLNGFLPTNSGDSEIVNFYKLDNAQAPCVNSSASPLETDTDFETAVVLIDQDASLFFYGVPLDERGGVDDTWYDIEYKEDQYLNFRVDKTYNDVSYRLKIEMVPAN
jgi:hypothetical protein